MNLAGDVESVLLRQMVLGMVTGLYASPAGRGRKERNLAGTNDGRVKFCVDMIDRGSSHRFLESVSIFLATHDQPLYQDVIGPHRRRRIDGLFGLTHGLSTQASR